MFKVRIYGAGSIGNHLANACRNKDWQVIICDIDPQALRRTKEDIYPSRYGRWDDEIQLSTVDQLFDETFDLAIIGTPPDSHIGIATQLLEATPPKAILIEKPLCPPSLEGCLKLVTLAQSKNVFVGVGYNHTLTEHTLEAERLLQNGLLNAPQTLSARFREHWGGIFNAHPWLSGPQDSYLGFWQRGGGASGEHSHAINIWQHFAHLMDLGKITEVTAALDLVETAEVNYDRLCQLHVKTERGLVGLIVQDVVTHPAQKSLRLQCDNGYLEWQVNWDESHDALCYQVNDGEVQECLFPKTRPDDFKGEIDHLEQILNGDTHDSPISLERGLETMMVIAATHKSYQSGRRIYINYDAGPCDSALEFA